MIQDEREDRESIPFTLAERINHVCDRFESDWRTGKRPRLDDSLVNAAHSERAALVRELLAIELHWRRKSGEQPAPSEYIEQFPGEAEAVHVAFMRTEARDGLGEPDRTVVRRGSGSTVPDTDATAAYSVGAATTDGRRFRVLRPHARGGLGAVFVALDGEFNREVALKQILERHADDAASRRRFLLEAEITGGLEHPGIVPVYGLGTYGDGRPYYAMRFIRGDSLKDTIARFHRDSTPKADPVGRSLEQRNLLRRFQDVCNAIDYAHSRGVVHRDIKPGNIIVGRYGETLVVDWGLAKPLGKSEPGDANDERSLAPFSATGSAETLPGSALGTPSYMSPEQARGDLEALGPRSDVYSLGATLYCLLTGKPPFAGDDVGAVLRSVQTGEFPTPRALDPSIDRALEAVCLKAMATNPEGRYSSARELVSDIELWLADQPVTAYAESVTERLGRWSRRHLAEVRAATAALLLITLTSLVAALLIDWARKEEKHRRLEAQALSARLARVDLDRSLMQCEQGLVGEGMLSMVKGVSLARTVKDGDLEAAIRRNLAGWRPEQATLLGVLPHQGWVACVAFSPDGRRVLTSSGDETASWGEVRLWDAATARPIGKPLAHGGMIHVAAFSPDGLTILAGDTGRDARLWDATTQRLIAVLRHGSSVTSVAFSPDGKTVLTGSSDNTARLWDVASGRQNGDEFKYDCPGYDCPVTYVAFSPDGDTAIVGGPRDSIWIHDAKTRKLVGGPLKQSAWFRAADLSRDGKILLVGCRDGTVRLWDLATCRQIGRDKKHDGRGSIVAVSLSPDGKIALTAGGDTTARFWDTGTAQQIGPSLPHGGWVLATAFSPDGRSALTACGDNTVRLWDVATGRPIGAPLRHGNIPTTVAFAPDGRRILTGGQDNTARLWEIAPAVPRRITLGEDGTISSASFSADGRVLLVHREDGTNVLVDLATGRRRDGSVRLPNQVFASSGGPPISPDGTKVLASTFGGAAQLWDLTTGQLEGQPLHGPSQSLVAGAFSPDGAIILTGSSDKTARLWDATRREPIGPPMIHDDTVCAVAFSPDGNRVLTGSQDNKARQWEAASPHRRIGPALEHGGWVRAVAYSRDGRTILTGSSDGTAQLWDAETGTRRGLALEHRAVVLAVAISRDARTVVIGCEDGTARFWDVATLRPIGPLLRHGGAVRALAFDPDDRSAWTISADGVLRRWEAPTPLRGTEDRLRLWLRVITGIELDGADGVHFLTASEWEQARRDYENSGGSPR
jgi:eukaryotic-like serine/threonine-protein kinase